MKKFISGVLIALVGAGVLAGCDYGNSTASNKAKGAAHAEQDAVANDLTNMLQSQPIPSRPYSQIRQNLIELETAQMDATQTTTFFFNQGVTDPVMSCPSIGFPIAATSQLTNPGQIIQDHNEHGGGPSVIPQIDPNGIYAGDSSGTYVMCIDAQGRPYASYWEGFVQTVTGPAKWDAAAHATELVGPPSFKFSKGQ